MAGGAGYYAIMGCATYWVAGALREERMTAGAAFGLSVAAYLLVPAVLLPGIAGATFLVLGWDLTLSSYSYCVDTSRSEERSKLGDCLFFLLVNPSVVYSHRGERTGDPRPDWRAGLRVILGISLMLGSSALLSSTSKFVAASSVGLLAPLPEAVGLVLLGLLRFLAAYASHSGLASIQLGLLRQTGYRAPERYRYPFLAISPSDFWEGGTSTSARGYGCTSSFLRLDISGELRGVRFSSFRCS